MTRADAKGAPPDRRAVEDIERWWAENVGRFDPSADGRDWPRWKLDVYLLLHREWRRRAVEHEEKRTAAVRRRPRPPRYSIQIQAEADRLARAHPEASARELWLRLSGDEFAKVYRADGRVYSDDVPDPSDDEDKPGGIARATFERHYVGRARKARQ